MILDENKAYIKYLYSRTVPFLQKKGLHII